MSSGASARSSLGYLKPYRPFLVGGVLALLATNLCALGIPYYVSRAVQALNDHRLAEVPREALLLEIDEAVARRFGEARAELLDAGRPVPGLDLMIAATTLRHGLVMVTQNVRDYANVPGPDGRGLARPVASRPDAA